MAVKLRLMRFGKKKQPTYRVVAADGRAPRDGRFIDILGHYDPRQEPSVVSLDTAKVDEWLAKGAQPTDRVRKLIEVARSQPAPVAADSRAPRNGRFIEILGVYYPRQDPSGVEIDNEKAVAWLRKGAQPTVRVQRLLQQTGAWDQFKGST